MKLVYVCSPFRGDVEVNIVRANRYCRFAATEGVVPLAPHTIFTQFLDDNDKEERETGIFLGLELLKHCEELWVFGSKVTEGMEKELAVASDRGMVIKYFNDKCELVYSSEEGDK